MKISFLYAVVAGVFLLSVAGQTLAAEKTDGTDNYNFAGHKFNVSSGEFDNEGICSVELDDMHPREYQITVETVSRPSLEDFSLTFNDMKKRCTSVTFIDNSGNISSEPRVTPDGVYRFEAKCFRGNGYVEGLYDTNKKFYRYVLMYDMTDAIFKKLNAAGVPAHMDNVLVRTCPFYSR